MRRFSLVFPHFRATIPTPPPHPTSPSISRGAKSGLFFSPSTPPRFPQYATRCSRTHTHTHAPKHRLVRTHRNTASGHPQATIRFTPTVPHALGAQRDASASSLSPRRAGGGRGVGVKGGAAVSGKGDKQRGSALLLLLPSSSCYRAVSCHAIQERRRAELCSEETGEEEKDRAI